ncbi:hypothetical protein [Methylomagnum sp.]
MGAFIDAIADWSLASGGLTLLLGETYTGSFPATGLASFAINPDAEAGGLPVSGLIYLDYELINYDSTVDAGTLTAQYSGQNALASVTVQAFVPAPGAAALLVLGLVGLVGDRARKRR